MRVLKRRYKVREEPCSAKRYLICDRPIVNSSLSKSCTRKHTVCAVHDDLTSKQVFPVFTQIVVIRRTQLNRKRLAKTHGRRFELKLIEVGVAQSVKAVGKCVAKFAVINHLPAQLQPQHDANERRCSRMIACRQQLLNPLFASHQQVKRDQIIAGKIRLQSLQSALQSGNGFFKSPLLHRLHRTFHFFLNLQSELLLLRWNANLLLLLVHCIHPCW